MLKRQLEEDLKKAVEELNYQVTDIVLSIPKNHDFGDYTTNVALQLAKQKGAGGKQNPVEIANKILEKLGQPDYLEKAEVAGGGFINFYLSTDALMKNVHLVCDYSKMVNPQIKLEGQSKKIMVEFTDPNPFKEFHIGHLFSNSVGESLARLLQATGAEVKRANYFGDVGMHIAKSVWGIKQKLKQEKLTLSGLEKKPLEDRIQFLGQAYSIGAKAYEEDKKAQEEMKQLNQAIYSKEGGELYEKGKQWSLDYFETIYAILGTKFDYYYPESMVTEYGLKLVLDHIDDGVFEKSDGAIIFPGDKYGLHRRVFINSLGLPTYEAKELGLALKKHQDFEYDQSIVVTGNEIKEYFQVLMMALSQINPDLAKKTTHIPHGMVRMIGGKISSRKGNVLTFEWLFNEVQKKVRQLMKDSQASEEKQQIIDLICVGAIKFSMLKSTPHTDVVFDLEKSVSLSGDSGPYVQYTYARAKSVLRTAAYDYQPTKIEHKLEIAERNLLRAIEYFPGVITGAAENYQPSNVVTFLLELSSDFNLFYQKHPIIKAKESAFRLALTCAIAVILKQGLYLLGIEAPERM